jgi:hypothetical protein
VTMEASGNDILGRANTIEPNALVEISPSLWLSNTTKQIESENKESLAKNVVLRRAGHDDRISTIPGSSFDIF